MDDLYTDDYWEVHILRSYDSDDSEYQGGQGEQNSYITDLENIIYDSPAEPVRFPTPAIIKVTNYLYECKICGTDFTSMFEHGRHFARHQPFCGGCGLKFDTWNEIDRHHDFCARKNGLKIIPRRVRKMNPKNKTAKTHICPLCKKKYSIKQLMVRHLALRCRVRYQVSSEGNIWVLKI